MKLQGPAIFMVPLYVRVRASACMCVCVCMWVWECSSEHAKYDRSCNIKYMTFCSTLNVQSEVQSVFLYITVLVLCTIF